jgi:hypothetical protein
VFDVGIFTFIALTKLAVILVILAAGFYVINTVLGWIFGGYLGFRAAKNLNKEDREWKRG